MDDGYPQAIATAFPGLPDDLDSAFIWTGNGRVYFTKGIFADQLYKPHGKDSGIDIGEYGRGCHLCFIYTKIIIHL